MCTDGSLSSLADQTKIDRKEEVGNVCHFVFLICSWF